MLRLLAFDSRLLEQIPHFLCCPGYSRGGSSRQAHGEGLLSSRCLCWGGWKHHPANLRGRDWELGYPTNSAFFSFSRLESPTHVCLTWWKAEFPRDFFFSAHNIFPWQFQSLGKPSCEGWHCCTKILSVLHSARFWPSAAWGAEECYLAISQTGLLQHSKFMRLLFNKHRDESALPLRQLCTKPSAVLWILWFLACMVQCAAPYGPSHIANPALVLSTALVPLKFCQIM